MSAVDEVRVDRALAGDAEAARALTPAERVAAVHQALTMRRWTVSRTAGALHLRNDTVRILAEQHATAGRTP